MKKLLIAALFVLSGSLNAMAVCPDIQSKSSSYSCTDMVYNDSGSNLTSGTVVVWDSTDANFTDSGYPYVTTTTTTDSLWTAGVVKDGVCLANNMCQIVTYGFAWTQVADSTDAFVSGDLVGTSAVAGMAGDYTVAADSCALGRPIALEGKVGGSDTGADGQVFPVFVDIACQ
jgi:hypothetical protein